VAEAAERDSKTEESTPQKREDALRKGNAPISREVATCSVLVAIGVGVKVAGVAGASELARELSLFVGSPGEYRLTTSADTVALLRVAATIAALIAGPIVLAVMLVGLLATAVQSRPRIAIKRISPKISRLSPRQGLERILGSHGRAEFLKVLLKICIVGIVIHAAARSGMDRVAGYLARDSRELPEILAAEVAHVFIVSGVMVSALAAADLVWTRFRWLRDLRMSRQEVKEELKQAEGDPVVRARQRSRARDRARRRMMTSVQRATLVVANPTHYAVAMRWVPGETPTPIVLAKGVDFIALRIREIATENRVPVVIDQALARSLHAAVMPDQAIPPEFYRAVAEVIIFVMSRRAPASAA
jgi:flagellar biosynthesis protein FlhB